MTIEVKNITKFYGPQKVLDDFNLNIESEHSYIITGPKGAGKTTLFNIIIGLEKPDEGGMQLLGDYKYPYICYGTVFEEDRLCEEKNAIDNVAMVSKKIFKETAREELLKFISEEDIYKPVKELSKRDRRFVCIVRATLIPNDLLIMDEPFTDLYEKDRERAIEYIRDKQGSGPLVIMAEDTKDLSFGRTIDLGKR